MLEPYCFPAPYSEFARKAFLIRHVGSEAKSGAIMNWHQIYTAGAFFILCRRSQTVRRLPPAHGCTHLGHRLPPPHPAALRGAEASNASAQTLYIPPPWPWSKSHKVAPHAFFYRRKICQKNKTFKKVPIKWVQKPDPNPHLIKGRQSITSISLKTS